MQTDLPPLTGAARFARLLVVGAIVVALAGLFAYTRRWLTPHALTPAHVIDRFEQVNGPHPGFRRNHAKGVGISGYFESNGQGTTYSKAVVFQPGRIPVLGRFALAGGQPYASDDPTTVRSMALLFKLPDGEEWRTGINNIPAFPFRTPEAFYDQLLATAPDPATGKPDPAKLKAFFEKYPESLKAIGLIKAQPPTTGFADSAYNSLNAFRLVNADGTSTPVRWSMVPVPSNAPATTRPATTAPTDKNALFDALIADVHARPLQWHLILTLGEPTDSTADPTIPWPPNRRHVDVGTLTIDHVEGEDTSPARDINFDPLVLPVGIEPSDDPILPARSATYARSFSRREREHKEPSAVSIPAAPTAAEK